MVELTKGHLKGAREFVSSLKKTNGPQPFCVVDNLGNIILEEKNAICLGPLFRTDWVAEKNSEPILFQTVVGAEHKDSLCSDDFIHSHLAWIVKDPLLAPFIPNHSAQTRRECGVPIQLVGVPRDVPLVASTHIRFPWDTSHNRTVIRFYSALRRKFPRWKWKCCFLIANLIGRDYEPLNKRTHSRPFSGVHSPFSDRITLEIARMYLYSPFKLWKKEIKFNLFGNRARGSVEDMFSERPKGNTPIIEVLDKILPSFPSYEKSEWRHTPPSIAMEDIYKLASVLKKEIENA